MTEALPATPDLPAIEERCRALWDETRIHRFDADGAGEAFLVDTPPPYASAGHLHVGHAMSFAQAEFMVRYQRMQGRRVFYPMGFDDNGLPTERYVERKHGVRKEETNRREFRRLCLEETKAVAATYEAMWRALGLSIDWSFSYSTIDDHCRRTAQRSFVELHRTGRIYRSDDPVFWDSEMQTALAQADLETAERTSWLYDIAFGSGGAQQLVISTTRPELLPACVALYHASGDPRYVRLDRGGATVPLFGHDVSIRSDGDVDPEFGTGLMMVCTFGDADDVRRWKRDQLETRTCVDEQGRLTETAGPYAGLRVEEARSRIVADLEQAGALVDKRRVKQRVAVSDRSGAVVELIMRPQWFVKVLDLRDDLLARAAELHWHPPWMQRRLEDWIHGLRHDWNISRQRFYGVPFPVWFCAACGEPIVAPEASLPVDPLEQPPPVPSCARCGSADLAGDPDVMDTWMTSSMTPQILTNWAGSPGRPRLDDWPLTVRPQAHDIIRTWLFYTLVKAHLHHDSVPWTDVMVSGFGLNEQGRGFSKRDLDPTRPAGTYSRYDPSDVIVRHGADALRHWAARSKLGQDARYHEKDVRTGRKIVLKLWNVARFFDTSVRLGALVDVPMTEPEDRWLLGRMADAVDAATAAFNAYDYAGAREITDAFLWTFTDDWLEIAKDRFWNPERHSDDARRSGAGSLRYALRTLLGLYAPFLPFITEEIYQRLFRDDEGMASIHVTRWPSADRSAAGAVPEMDIVLAVLRAVRALRTEQRISQGAELDAVVVDVREDAELAEQLRAVDRTLRAAVRAHEVQFGSASGATEVPGLFVSIVT